MTEIETTGAASPRDPLTLFVFTPRGGMERLFGPVHTITDYEAAMADSFGDWVECTPVRLRIERLSATGTVVERDRFNADGTLRDHAVYAYERDGRLIERTHYDGQGNAYLRYTYTADNEGRLVEMTGLDPNGAERSRLQRHYTDDGRLAGLVEWRDTTDGRGPEESQWRIGYANDGSVTHAESEMRRDGELIERTMVRYDRAGNVSETARLAADGAWIEKSRQLIGPQKERGNWVRRVTEHCVRRFGQEQFQPVSVTYRRFTFYAD